MKICIDARWIFEEVSGIGCYTRELIRNLIKSDRKNEYVIIFNKKTVMDRTIEETDMDQHPSFHPELVESGLFSPLGQIMMARWLRRKRIDVYHSPNYMIPLPAFPTNEQGKTACVVTIHDVIPLAYPGHAPRSKKTRLFPLYRHLMKQVAARADVILTVSNASAKEISQCIPTAKPSKIRVVYNGVSEFFSPAVKQNTRTPAQISLLYVGRSDPYKNTVTLAPILKLLKQKTDKQCKLIIAGSPDPRYPEMMNLAHDSGLSDDITWTGYIGDPHLLGLYRDSTVLVHPSRAEGFGLQVVEAMACGLPVVCSDIPALKEVAGDCALYAAPDDVEGFVNRILQITEDSELRAKMVDKGLERAKVFTWESSAEGTLKIYEEVFRMKQ